MLEPLIFNFKISNTAKSSQFAHLFYSEYSLSNDNFGNKEGISITLNGSEKNYRALLSEICVNPYLIKGVEMQSDQEDLKLCTLHESDFGHTAQKNTILKKSNLSLCFILHGGFIFVQHNLKAKEIIDLQFHVHKRINRGNILIGNELTEIYSNKFIEDQQQC